MTNVGKWICKIPYLEKITKQDLYAPSECFKWRSGSKWNFNIAFFYKLTIRELFTIIFDELHITEIAVEYQIIYYLDILIRPAIYANQVDFIMSYKLD